MIVHLEIGHFSIANGLNAMKRKFRRKLHPGSGRCFNEKEIIALFDHRLASIGRSIFSMQ
jgi:hypothetical protein